MVRTRRKKNARSSNKTHQENEAADNDLVETETSDPLLVNETATSDPLLVNVDQPMAGVPCENNVEKSLHLETNEKEEETHSGERKIALKVDSDDENMIITETNHEILAEDQNTSKDNELDYQKDGMGEDHEENSEGNNKEYDVDKHEVDVELESEDDEVSEEDDEVSEEDDEESEEDDEESEEGGDESEEGDEELQAVEEELGEEEKENENELEEKEKEQIEEEREKVKGEEKEKEKEEVKRSADGGKPERPNTKKVESDLKDVVDKAPGRTRKKLLARTSKKVESREDDKLKSSRTRKSKKRVKSMGMIFMCSSATKSDCYRYRVLGLPASKKDMVEKIYTGMRLFLYDVDLKLLNGIYKAAGPGGYNIEPNAFNSQFPSQVRFTVMNDCLPIAEGKFKKVIKDNYYTSTKFDCLLNSEQVKKLCKLFVATSKRQRQKSSARSSKAESRRIVLRDRPRKQRADEVRRHEAREELRVRERPRKRPRLAITSVVPVPSSAPSYAYERTLEVDTYRQNSRLESHDLDRGGRGPLLSRGDSYRDRRDPPAEIFGSYRDGREYRDYYRDGRDPPPDRQDPYQDGRDSYLERRSPYRNEQGPYLQRGSPYRDGREAYQHRQSPYRDGQDLHAERRDPYRNGRDLHVERRDPYRDGRDMYPERRSPYRDGRDTYIERHNDMRDSYLQRPYQVSPQTEPRDAYRRGPISGRQDFYREDRLAETRDSYERLRVRDVQPTHLEMRRLPNIGSNRDSYVSYRLPYAEPTRSTEYHSRAILERDYRPVGPVTDLYSTRGRLADYSSRRA